jgi:hypothetical protein
MQRRTAKAAQAQRAKKRRPDARLAAFARLLAHHAAEQDFQKELSARPNGAYPPEPFSGDAPEDPS